MRGGLDAIGREGECEMGEERLLLLVELLKVEG